MPPSAPVVTVSSLLSLLNSFVSVLDEPGLKATRGDECVRIIIEALLRLDSTALSEPAVEMLREGIEGYVSSRRIEKELFADGENQAQWLDVSWQILLLSVPDGTSIDPGNAVRSRSSTLSPRSGRSERRMRPDRTRSPKSFRRFTRP